MSCGASFLWGYFLTLLVRSTVKIADCNLFFICYLIRILYLAGENVTLDFFCSDLLLPCNTFRMAVV